MEPTAVSSKVKEENCLLLPGIEHRLCDGLALSVLTVLAESSQVLLHKLSVN